MEYGKYVVNSMKPIVRDAGEIKNEDSLPAETTITREIKTVRTVIASSTSRWKAGGGVSFTLKYKSPGPVAATAGSFSASLTFSGDILRIFPSGHFLDTVKPPVSRHPRGQKKCPLTRGVQLWEVKKVVGCM